MGLSLPDLTPHASADDIFGRERGLAEDNDLKGTPFDRADQLSACSRSAKVTVVQRVTADDPSPLRKAA